MSFSLWHWAIVAAIMVIAFWRQIPSLILHITDPGLALRHRLGMLNAKDREAMLRKQERIQIELRQKGWFLIVGVFAVIFAWKTLSSLPARTLAATCSTPTGNYEVSPAAIGSSCTGPTGASGLIVR